MKVTTERLEESMLQIKEELIKNYDGVNKDSLYFRFLEIMMEIDSLTNDLKALRVMYKRATKRPKKN
jgi:hypothetical protein